MPEESRTFRFSKAHRLRSRVEFSRVFEVGVAQVRGPLKMVAAPNDLGHSRLGISVSRSVGIAARRNRIKRLLRESFRLMPHELPPGYDVVIVVRPHVPLTLREYQELLADLIAKCHARWQRRAEEGESKRRM